MPIYAYRCTNCGFAQDVLQKMSDPLLTVCPNCGQSTFAKQVTAAGFQLKGSGWYVTDFRGDGKGGQKADDKAEGGPKEGSEKTAGDAKPASGDGGEAAKADAKPSSAPAPAAAAAPAAAPSATPAPPAAKTPSSSS